MKKKTTYYLLILLIFVVGISSIAIYKKNSVLETLRKTFFVLPDEYKTIVLAVTGRTKYQNVSNDYNVRFLPKTQYLNLNYSKIKLNFRPKDKEKENYFLNRVLKIDYIKNYPFYLDIFKENIYITTKSGFFYKFVKKKILSENKKIDLKEIKTNLSVDKVLDSAIINDEIFISAAKTNKNCINLILYKSKIDTTSENFNFEVFKKFDECGKNEIGAGRIQSYKFSSQHGILLSTRSNYLFKDAPSNKPQDDKSIFGKTIFINLNNKDHFIFSKGHREIQGLFVNGDLILSSEHGPKGGDEINKLNYLNNYGWPISSYGQAYKKKEKKYYKSHNAHGFIEPLFVFLPSIGISEIFIVPNDFSEMWKNSLLVTSLNGKSIYRLQFLSDKFEKVVYNESIFVGQRIRDIKYLTDEKIFLLALETTGAIGIIQK